MKTSSFLQPTDKTMPEDQQNNPLHGVTLKVILEHLVAQHGWDRMADMIDIRCFTHNPTIKSSLTFLRKTPWARERVEKIYLKSLRGGFD